MNRWIGWLTGLCLLGGQAFANISEPPSPAGEARISIESAGHTVGFARDSVRVERGDQRLEIGFVQPNTESAPVQQDSHIRYSELWDGIDLVYDTSEGILRSTYEVQPGADPHHIRLQYDASVSLTSNGFLSIATNEQRFLESPPIAWQVIDGEHVPVDVVFSLADSNQLGFRLGAYDPDRELIIDPVLLSEFWPAVLGDGPSGGTEAQEFVAITTDAVGNVYVAGYANAEWSVGVPTPASGISGGNDVYVAKLAPDGTIAWHTYLGGTSNDSATAIFHDGTNLYIAGATASSAWSDGWTDSSINYQDGDDVFVARLDPDTGSPLELDVFGGPYNDRATGMEVTASNIYLTGSSRGGNWATGTEKYAANTTDYNDIFITKLDSQGNVLWVSFFGQAGEDLGHHLVVDSTASRVYAVGHSTDTWGTPQRGFTGSGSGLADLVVIALDLNGTYIQHTFLGGEEADYGSSYRSLALQTTTTPHRLYLIGYSSSPNWGESTPPVSPQQGSNDIVIAALNASNLGLYWYSYYGSSGTDIGSSIVPPDGDNLFFTGYSSSDWSGVALEDYQGLGEEGVIGMVDAASGTLISHSFHVAGDPRELPRDLVGTDYGIAVTGAQVTLYDSGGLGLSTQRDGYVAGFIRQGRMAVLDGVNEIPDGATFDFGTVDPWGSLTKPFTIRNVGTDILYIDLLTGGLYVDYNPSSEFTVTAQPVFPATAGDGDGILAPGEEGTFSMLFDPLANGAFFGDISIRHQTDSGIGMEQYIATATGVGAGSAIPGVYSDVHDYIPSGTTTTSVPNGTEFGQWAQNSESLPTHTFILENDGAGDLHFNVNVVDDANPDHVNFTPVVLLADPIYPETYDYTILGKLEGESATQAVLNISFTPVTTGAISGQVQIVGEDSQGNSHVYTYAVSGSALGPDISVTGNNANIPDGLLSTETAITNHTSYGSVQSGDTLTRTYTITNLGTGSSPTSDLVISSIAVNDGAGNFTLTSNPVQGGDLTLLVGETATFQVTFQPGAAGDFAGEVVIVSNDADAEGTFSFAVTGGGIGAPSITLSPANVTVTERDAQYGLAQAVTISLSAPPAGNVFLNLAINTSGEIELTRDDVETVSAPFWQGATSSLLFAPGESATRTIYIRGKDDGAPDLDTTSRITVSVDTTNTADPAYLTGVSTKTIYVTNRNRHYHDNPATAANDYCGVPITVLSGETLICRFENPADITGSTVQSNGTLGVFAPSVSGSATTRFNAGSSVQIGTGTGYLDTTVIPGEEFR